MPGWDEILRTLQNTPSPLDTTRHNYLKQLSEYTKRNVIIYYSAFNSRPASNNLDINDSDMEGFMNAVHGLDCSTGLDLILHTPGGDPAAAESIVKYLRSKFNKDIRIIVPHMAMSAGTMMACSGKEIIMGRQSSLGPIDPQFMGIPCYNIIQEYEQAKEDLSKYPENAPYWAIKLQQYPAAFMITAQDFIDLSTELLKSWLGDNMFTAGQDDKKIEDIVNSLNEHENSKLHGRHFDIEFCKNIGLKIQSLEEDNTLQDLVLSVHHVCMLTFGSSPAAKIIENQEGKAYIVNTEVKR